MRICIGISGCLETRTRKNIIPEPNDSCERHNLLFENSEEERQSQMEF